jgi:hypothetical protein
MTVAEVLLAALTVIGLLSLGWSLFGRMLTPVGPGAVYAVVPASGGGEGLEQTVRGLLWLRGGELAGLTVLVADTGLNEQGRQLAEGLCRQWEQVLLCGPETLEHMIWNKGEE